MATYRYSQNTGLSDSVISSKILEECATIRDNKTFTLLPDHMKADDESGILRAMSEASTAEYDRALQAVKGTKEFNNVRTINKNYAVSFQASVTDISRTFVATFTSDSTIAFSGEWISLADGYLNGFGIQFKTVSFSGTTIGTTDTNNQYRKISSFVVSGGVATAELDFTVSNGNGDTTVAVICYPDRIDVPGVVISDPRHEEGTVLPVQSTSAALSSLTASVVGHSDTRRLVVLPGHSYIKGVPAGSWDGWSIKFIDGELAGTSYVIDAHLENDDYIVLSLNNLIELDVENDWVMLVPPASEFFSVTENAYRGMYAQTSAESAPNAYYVGTGVPKQTRQIVASEFLPMSIPAKSVAYVYDALNDDGAEFNFPPVPNSFVGISDTYVELAQLAEFLGIEIDDLDPEQLQREQIASAYDFHRIRGTKKGIELLCRLRGFSAAIVENASTFTTDGGTILNKNAGVSSSVPHIQFSGDTVDPDLLVPQSGQGVPRSYRATAQGMNDARIPDSDISIYLERANPLSQPSSIIFQRLYKQLSELATPAHVDIIFFGLLQRFNDIAEMTETVAVEATFFPNFPVDVANELYAAFLGDGQSIETLQAIVSNGLLLTSALRYDTQNRYPSEIPEYSGPTPRFTLGITRIM